MISFQVSGMTCGHCVNAVIRAAKSVDRRATVSVNLAAKRVEIASTAAGAPAFKAAIEDAGYGVRDADAGTASVASSGGCCS